MECIICKKEVPEHRKRFCSDKCKNRNKARKYYYTHRNKVKDYFKQRYENNKEKLLLIQSEYGQKNRDKISEKAREYRNKHKKQIRKKARDYYHKTKDTDLGQKRIIREKTLKKYGKLIKGFDYHHTTIPYSIDIWVGMDSIEHKRLHSSKRVNGIA